MKQETRRNLWRLTIAGAFATAGISGAPHHPQTQDAVQSTTQVAQTQIIAETPFDIVFGRIDAGDLAQTVSPAIQRPLQTPEPEEKLNLGLEPIASPKDREALETINKRDKNPTPSKFPEPFRPKRLNKSSSKGLSRREPPSGSHQSGRKR